MKGVSFQDVLSSFPGMRLPSRRPLYWQCDYLCELSSHFFMKAELQEIVKSQPTAFATFFGRKTLPSLGVRMSRTRRMSERGSSKALA
jgi:hypothetical protein